MFATPSYTTGRIDVCPHIRVKYAYPHTMLHRNNSINLDNSWFNSSSSHAEHTVSMIKKPNTVSLHIIQRKISFIKYTHYRTVSRSLLIFFKCEVEINYVLQSRSWTSCSYFRHKQCLKGDIDSNLLRPAKFNHTFGYAEKSKPNLLL